MSRLNELIAKEIAEWEVASGRKETPPPRDNVTSPSVDTRRLIILGGLLGDYFPEFLRFQPQATEAENQVEFAPVAGFLASLAGDKEYVNRLMEQVMKPSPSNVCSDV